MRVYDQILVSCFVNLGGGLLEGVGERDKGIVQIVHFVVASSRRREVAGMFSSVGSHCF